jgi:hypothetical protein
MPRRVDHEERRAPITAALLRIASTRGLQAVSMREVAAEAGVSLRPVQYYFTDKRPLMRPGLDELAARLDRRVKERAAGPGHRPGGAGRARGGAGGDPAHRRGRPARPHGLDGLLRGHAHGPGIAGGATDHPGALENYLTGTLTRAPGRR